MLAYKAEWAGCELVEVNPRNTSRTCPDCGTIKAKTLSRRTHTCGCGCVMDRDHAAARVILARAVMGPEAPAAPVAARLRLDTSLWKRFQSETLPGAVSK